MVSNLQWGVRGGTLIILLLWRATVGGDICLLSSLWTWVNPVVTAMDSSHRLLSV